MITLYLVKRDKDKKESKNSLSRTLEEDRVGWGNAFDWGETIYEPTLRYARGASKMGICPERQRYLG